MTERCQELRGFGRFSGTKEPDNRRYQPLCVRRIGVLLPSAAENPEYQPWVGAFLQELSQLGWSIGRNVRIDTR
ncbi:MAG: hypothetical protein WA720_20670, partial [Pseudolabrys sp.]